MIDDLIPWKEELVKTAERLRKKKTQTRWTERSGFIVERDIMVGAYAVRRLIEAWKVSDVLVATRIRVEQHAPLDKEPTPWNRWHWWELYDLDRATKGTLSLAETCSQIIHSWIWAVSATESDEFNGIYVVSDRKRTSGLYFIHVDALIELFDRVGSEDIIHKEWRDDVGFTKIEADPTTVPCLGWLIAPQ